MVSQLFLRRAIGVVASAAALAVPSIAAASDHAPTAPLKHQQIVTKSTSLVSSVISALDKGRKHEASEFEPPGQPIGRPPEPPGQHDPPNPPGKPPDRPPDNSNSGGNK